MNYLTFQARSRRDTLWLAEQQQDDGSIAVHNGIRGFYKAAFAPEKAGLPGHANRLLSWIKAHAMPGPGVVFVAPEKRVTGEEFLYRSRWVLRAAIVPNRFDIVSPDALARVLEQKDSCGGFRPCLSGSEHRLIDPPTAAMAGRLCLNVRRMEQARGLAIISSGCSTCNPSQQRSSTTSLTQKR